MTAEIFSALIAANDAGCVKIHNAPASFPLNATEETHYFSAAYSHSLVGSAIASP